MAKRGAGAGEGGQRARSAAAAAAPTPAAQTAREPLITLAAFLDGAVAVSGVPVMVAQGAFVSFPSGSYLAAYQLCFLLPQLVTTLLAEQLTTRLSAPALLYLTLVCTTGSAAVVGLSLSRGALALFFASRLINGFFRHDKTLFALTAKALRMPESQVGAAARYGMMAGMLCTGVAGDVMADAIQVAYLFAAVEAVAATLVLLRLLQGTRGTVVMARMSEDYARWLPTLTRAPAAPWRAMAVLVAAMLAASVNQVMYALVAPVFGLSYSFTGAHLCFNLVLQLIAMPHIVAAAKKAAQRWPSNAVLAGTAEEKLMLAAGLVLLGGCAAVPAASDHGPAVFYPVTLLTVDIPAGILTTLAAAAAHGSFGKAHGDAAKVARLLGHVTQVVKLFAAPLRICMREYFSDRKHSVRYISIPLMLYALVYTRTHKVLYAAVAAAAVLFYCVSPQMSFAGEL